MHPKFAKQPLLRGFNFSSIFGGGGGVAHNGNGAVTQIPPANPQQQLSGAPAPAPAPVAATPAPAPAPADPIGSQLDKFKAVWNTPTDAEGKPLAPQQDPLYQPLFQLKAEDVQKGAATLDFTAGIKPELFQAVAAGGEEAVAAMRQIMNETARAAFAGSVMNSQHLVNGGFAKHAQALDQVLPTRIRDHAVNTTKSEDPVFSHPAVAPVVNSLRTVIAKNNPNLSAAEAQKQVEDFIGGIAEAIGASKQTQQQQTAAKEDTDWMAFSGLAAPKS